MASGTARLYIWARGGRGEGWFAVAIHAAEYSFRRGYIALMHGDPATASVHFQTAIVIERQMSVARPQMRYLSYYGLSLAQAQGATLQAIQACEVACRHDFFNADLLLNLGRVYLLAEKTTKALGAFERGLQMSPNHKGLLAEHAKFDRRERPPLSVVSRRHPLNKMLGKLRWSFRSRAGKLIRTSRTAPPS
jgi:tetratricopeptide (TPR) repeat protein